MRVTTLLPLAAGMMLAAPAAASADFLHVITPGESLYSVAAADGLSVGQLAAANGISSSTQLIAGSTLAIPPQSAGLTTGEAYGDDSGTGSGSTATPVSNAAPVSSSASGSYVVQPGDTLSAVAAREGMSVAELAALNGLDPNGYLLSGSVLRFSGASGSTTFVSSTSSGSAAESQPVGAAAEGSPTGPPYPTPERVSAGEVGSIAAANGVPPSLAQAIGLQESGFNNDLVSAAGARGVMQILPGTWQWINASLAPSPLSPYSASDNVRGGVLMLHSLLNATGGSPSMAAAGYYQGLPSVQRNGLFPETQRYVKDVMSLASAFGGG
jgi:LysM repeat protein